MTLTIYFQRKIVHECTSFGYLYCWTDKALISEKYEEKMRELESLGKLEPTIAYKCKPYCAWYH